jgi:hypothetical protein
MNFFGNFQPPDDDKDKIIMKRMDRILTVSQHDTFLQYKIHILLFMSDKKEIDETGLSVVEAERRELDEQPKPTRKVSHPARPSSNKDEPSTHDKIKGRRIIK